MHRFQPPNAWHEVYTPSKSVTVGGHYYTYDTLHLSDAARHFDIVRPGTTNQHHTSSQLTMSSMLVHVISLGPRRTSVSSHICTCVDIIHRLLPEAHHISVPHDIVCPPIPFPRGEWRW